MAFLCSYVTRVWEYFASVCGQYVFGRHPRCLRIHPEALLTEICHFCARTDASNTILTWKCEAIYIYIYIFLRTPSREFPRCQFCHHWRQWKLYKLQYHHRVTSISWPLLVFGLMFLRVEMVGTWVGLYVSHSSVLWYVSHIYSWYFSLCGWNLIWRRRLDLRLQDITIYIAFVRAA